MELQFLIIGLFLLGIGTVGSSDVKSNLAFVIDVTESMDVDIKQVTKAVDAIVDTVAKSSASPIDEYVLVTFNGDTNLVTKTKDKADLKKKLGAINVSGGSSTCPEKSLSGIELALNEIKEGSYLYVFTDASPEDYKNYNKVEALSQKIGAQVVFLLTGVYNGNIGCIDYQMYHNLAKATNGQVFHLKKDEIGEILKYVEETVSIRKDVILSKTLPARQISAFTVNVDEDIKDFVIAVSGENPNIYVSDPKGAEQPLTNVTRLQNIAIVKVANATPGEYKAQVGSPTAVSVVVTATASVHFQHGFSTVAPDDITETVRRPAPEKKSYLSIKLLGGDHVKLENVHILSMDDRIMLEEPLKLVNKQKDFYTTELIDTPNAMFKIAVNGYDTKKKSNLTRHGITPVQPQNNIGLITSATTPGGRFNCQLRAVAATPTPTNCTCGYKYQNRIVGGNETGINEFPMMAGVIYLSQVLIRCGGTIVDKRYVLTAAHCVVGKPASEIAVVVGEHNTTFGETNATQVFNVERIIVHPQFNSSNNDNDIAILRVAQDITIGDRVGPACLPFKFQNTNFTGAQFTLLGWGTTSFGEPTSSALRKVDVDVISQSSCRNAVPSLTARQVCTYTPGKDACQDDSGGPALYMDSATNRLFVAGIISYGRSCAEDGKPGINTRVTCMLAWLEDNTPDASYCVK